MADPWAADADPIEIPEELAGVVKPELQPGERLLWAARSLPRSAPRGRGPLALPFYATASIGASVAAFYAIFGPARPSLLGVEPLLIAVGVISAIFGVVGSIIAAGLRLDRWSDGGVSPPRVHALTDRRAILWIYRKGSEAVEVITVARGSISAIHRLEYPDGSGDVIFSYRNDHYFQAPTGFEGVADVRAIEDLTRRTLLERASATSS